MTQAASDTEFIEAMPPAMLREPLEWLFAEHFRHRQWCRLIETLAQSTVYDEARLDAAIGFLRHDIPLHIQDEEDDLFPLLRRRARREDDIGRILGLLSADHRNDHDHVRPLLAGLKAARSAQRAPGADLALSRRMLDFVTLERRHIALENAIVLPLARLRLRSGDLVALSGRLAARRGMTVETPLH